MNNDEEMDVWIKEILTRLKAHRNYIEQSGEESTAGWSGYSSRCGRCFQNS